MGNVISRIVGGIIVMFCRFLQIEQGRVNYCAGHFKGHWVFFLACLLAQISDYERHNVVGIDTRGSDNFRNENLIMHVDNETLVSAINKQ